MANENAQLAEFADNLWNNYIKQKYKDECKNVLTYYRATVVSNDGSNRLTIQRPFDTAYQVSCTDAMSAVTAGTNVIVLVYGDGVNKQNHIVVALSNGNTPAQAPDPAVQWEAVTPETGWTISSGGYFTEGQHVYVYVRFRGNALTADTSNIVLTGFPKSLMTNPPLTVMAGNRMNGIAYLDADGTSMRYRPSEAVASTNFIIINGHYIMEPEEPEITVDTALSTVSTNPVQNKVVTLALQDKANVITKIEGTTYATTYADGTSV